MCKGVWGLGYKDSDGTYRMGVSLEECRIQLSNREGRYWSVGYKDRVGSPGLVGTWVWGTLGWGVGCSRTLRVGTVWDTRTGRVDMEVLVYVRECAVFFYKQFFCLIFFPLYFKLH